MKKTIILAAVLIITILTLGNISLAQFKSGSEPDGFREIKWGTNLSKIKGLELVGTSNYWGEER
jgi:hypothetical protein